MSIKQEAGKLTPRFPAPWPSAAAAYPGCSLDPGRQNARDAKWRTISWRTGTKGKLTARFAAVRERIADGPSQRIREKGQQHLPGKEAWLAGEQRPSGERNCYLARISG